jgi:hypothetical protein
MEINSLPHWIDGEFEFPLSKKAVIDRAGNLEVDAPDRANSETLATILERGGDEMYQSREELLTGIRRNLSDEYIGRKYYDDRGSNPVEQERGTPRDTVDRSL